MANSKNSRETEVKDYFNGTGFDRWKRIYSKSEEVNTVRRISG